MISKQSLAVLFCTLFLGLSVCALADEPLPGKTIDAEVAKYKNAEEANREIYRGILKNYYSGGPAQFGELLILNDHFEQLEKRLGPLYLPSDAPKEWLEKESVRLQQRLHAYHHQVAEAQKTGGLSLTDAVNAVQATASKTSRYAIAADVVLFLGKIDEADFNQRFGVSLRRSYANGVLANSSAIDRWINSLDEKVSRDPAFAKLMDTTVGAKLQASVKAPARDNLQRQTEWIEKKFREVQAENGVDAKAAARAMQVDLRGLKKRMKALEEGNRLTRIELEEMRGELTKAFGERIDELRKDLAELKERDVRAVDTAKKAELHRLEMEAYGATIHTVAQGLSFFGEDGKKAARILQTLGDASLNLVSALEKSRALAEGGKHLASGLMAATGYVGMVLAFVSILASDSPSNFEPMLLEEMRALRAQLHQLRHELHARLDIVNVQLDRIYFNLLSELDRATANQRISTEALVSVLAELKGLGEQLSFSLATQRTHVSALSDRLKLGTHLPAMIHENAGMTPDKFDAGMQAFFDCASKHAFDSLGAGATTALPDSETALIRLILNADKPKSATDRGRNVATQLAIAEKLYRSERGAAPGNPYQWAYCAGLYLKALATRPHLYPGYAKTNGLRTGYEFDQLIEAGERIQNSFGRIEPSMLEHAIRKYKENSDALRAFYSSKEGRARYLDVDVASFENLGIPVKNLRGLDPWAAQQDKATLKKVFHPLDQLISKCDDQKFEFGDNSKAPQLTLPADWNEWFANKYQAFAIADSLKLGRVRLCYRKVEWVNHRHKLMNDHYLSPSQLSDPETEKKVDYEVQALHTTGNLSFEIVATYVTASKTAPIFSRRFTSKEETLWGYGIAARKLNDPAHKDWKYSYYYGWRGGETREQFRGWRYFREYTSEGGTTNGIQTWQYSQIFKSERWRGAIRPLQRKEGEAVAEETADHVYRDIPIPRSAEAGRKESELMIQLEKQWPTLRKTGTETAETPSDEAATAALSQATGEVAELFRRARAAINREVRILATVGGAGFEERLRNASEGIDGHRSMLETLLSYRLPVAMSSDLALQGLFFGNHPLPDRAAGLDLAMDETLHSLDLENARKSFSEARLGQLAPLGFAEVLPATLSAVVAKQRLADAETQLAWTMSLKELADSIENYGSETSFVSIRVSINEVRALRESLAKRQIPSSQLLTLQLIALHRAIFEKRLENSGYRESHWVVADTLKRLKIFRDSYGELTKAK